MTRNVRFLLAALACSALLPRPSVAQDRPLIWYDEARQAVGIDPHAEAWGLAPIDLDFDAQHAAAATVLRSRATDALGLVVDPGVFDTRSLYCPGIGWSATLTLYGWADPLGSLSPVQGYVDTVTRLDFYGAPIATDRFQFFTEEWDVEAGASALYVRPLDASDVPVPVTRELAEGAWYRVGAENPWIPLPLPAPPTPVAAGLKITPRALSLRSQGQWITARLVLPPGYAVEAVDVDSLRLALVSAQVAADGALQQSVRHESGPLRVVDEDGLLVKFNRSDLQAILFPGDASLTLTGSFVDGTRFAATSTIRVLP